MSITAPRPDITDHLETEAIDLLVSAPDKAGDNLMRKLFFGNEFVPAQHCGQPRGRHTLDLDIFCALDYLLISADGGGFYGQIDSALAALGRTRQVAVSIQSYALAQAFPSTADRVCTMPRLYFSRHAEGLGYFGLLICRRFRYSASGIPASEATKGHMTPGAALRRCLASCRMTMAHDTGTRWRLSERLWRPRRALAERRRERVFGEPAIPATLAGATTWDAALNTLT